MHSWTEFVSTLEQQPLRNSEQICALAGIAVINAAIWVLLCVLLMFPIFGLCMTVMYGLILVAVIRRAERVPENRTLVDFLCAGIPVVFFVVGVYATRVFALLAGIELSARLTLCLVALVAAAPSFAVSLQLLFERKGGPLVVNVMFGLWLLLLTMRLAAWPSEKANGNSQGFQVVVQLGSVADFAAYVLAIEGIVGSAASLVLHRSSQLPELVTWLQALSSMVLLVAMHYILRLPAWSSIGSDLPRWCCYAMLCWVLLKSGSATGRLSPGICAATGFFFVLLRLAAGATDVARFALGFTWVEDKVMLVCVFSLVLAATGFAIVCFVAQTGGRR